VFTPSQVGEIINAASSTPFIEMFAEALHTAIRLYKNKNKDIFHVLRCVNAIAMALKNGKEEASLVI
jgi:hypothetical protein